MVFRTQVSDGNTSVSDFENISPEQILHHFLTNNKKWWHWDDTIKDINDKGIKAPRNDNGTLANWGTIGHRRDNHTYEELVSIFNDGKYGKCLEDDELVIDFDGLNEEQWRLNKFNAFVAELRRRGIAFYCEKSPSGNGRHVIVYCIKMNNKLLIKAKGLVEMLSGSYVTYTGKKCMGNTGRATTSLEMETIIRNIYESNLNANSNERHISLFGGNIAINAETIDDIIPLSIAEVAIEYMDKHPGNHYISIPGEPYFQIRGSFDTGIWARFQLFEALIGNFDVGNRNRYFVLLANWFYRAGIDKELAIYILQLKNDSLEIPLDSKEVECTVNSIYRGIGTRYYNIFPYPEKWHTSYLKETKYGAYLDRYSGKVRAAWRKLIKTNWGDPESILDPVQFLLWNLEIPCILAKTKNIWAVIRNTNEISSSIIAKSINDEPEYIRIGDEWVKNPRYCSAKQVTRILTMFGFEKLPKRTNGETWFRIDLKNFNRMSSFIRLKGEEEKNNKHIQAFLLLLLHIAPRKDLYEQIKPFARRLNDVIVGSGVVENYKSEKNNTRFMENIGVVSGRVVSHKIFGDYAQDLLKSRYVYGNESVYEIPHRIANYITRNDKEYSIYKDMIGNLEFLPNSPTIMNAGTSNPMLSACFVFSIDDNIEDIYNKVKYSALVHKYGGGTGFTFSHLRPEGDKVGSTNGVSSGPVDFMRLFDTSTFVIKQGGKRRGANLGELDINHPDIEKFIFCKSDNKSFSNFNLSIGYFNDFMKALQADKDYPLINPRTGEEVRSVNANELFDKIAYNVWQTGDPGCLFLDTINKYNPVKDEIIETTNPCSEANLPTKIIGYDGEVAGSCNLGSINLNRIIKDNEIDWEHFSYLIRNGIRFLDSVIDKNKFPFDFIEMTTKRSRRIGLGFMGLADLFLRLDIPYNSPEAFELAEKLTKFMYEEARDESHQLALEYGDFPAIDNSIFKGTNMRNATVLSIAPTGSIGMIANASTGCEPLFYAGYKKSTYLGDELVITEGVIDYLKRHNLYSQETLNNISNYTDDVIVIAHQIHWADHIKMQATIQKYVDLAVSKTINMPSGAGFKDIKDAYIMAWKSGCKGITVFRDGSRASVIQKCDGESCTL